MEKMDLTTSMSAIDVIRMRREAYVPIGPMARAFLSAVNAETLTHYPTDVDFLLGEIDLLTSEKEALKSRELARLNAHLHIDTEPRRRKTIGNLPYVGIDTALGVLREGGCIAVDLKGTEAVITAGNVAVGRLRPGVKQELREAGEMPIMARFGSIVTFSQHPVTLDPLECKVGG